MLKSTTVNEYGFKSFANGGCQSLYNYSQRFAIGRCQSLLQSTKRGSHPVLNGGCQSLLQQVQ